MRWAPSWKVARATRPTTCFETFSFPEPTDAQRETIGEAAALLNERREGWLNPPNAKEAELKKRTLTNLYNQRPTWLSQPPRRAGRRRRRCLRMAHRPD